MTLARTATSCPLSLLPESSNGVVMTRVFTPPLSLSLLSAKQDFHSKHLDRSRTMSVYCWTRTLVIRRASSWWWQGAWTISGMQHVRRWMPMSFPKIPLLSGPPWLAQTFFSRSCADRHAQRAGRGSGQFHARTVARCNATFDRYCRRRSRYRFPGLRGEPRPIRP